MAELHDLTAAYALDALDESERARFEDHLNTCGSCRDELSRLRQGATHLAESAAQPPPAHLKSQIMARIESADPGARQLRPAEPRSRRWEWAFAAAAVLAVVFGGLLLVLNERLDRAETIAAIHQARDSVSISLDSVVGSAEFVYSQELGVGVFLDRGLAEPAGDRVYELWLVGDSGPAPAGIFRPGGDEVVVGDLAGGLVLAMTEEPAGGSDQPTGEILFTAEL